MATLQPPVPPQPSSFTKSVSSFSARFGKDDDQVAVTEEERRKRQQTAVEGTDQYYDFATSAYENGWGQRFHYGPFAPGETILQAMIFYEHQFAHIMGLKPGMKVLDVGCGIGGPAREIAKLTGCEIVGITINQRQVDRARELTAQAGMEDKCIFMKGDFLDLPFPDSSFDAAYAIEATCHAPSLISVYSGIGRVLKPDAVFGISEWLMTPLFDAANPKHIGIRNRIERGNALSNLQTSDQCRVAMTSAGFDIYHDEDFALHWTALGRSSHRPSIPGFPCVSTPPNTNPYHQPLPDTDPSTKPPIYRPWYYPMAGQTRHAEPGSWPDYRTALMMTPLMRRLCFLLVWILEHLRIYPRGTLAAMTTMAYCVDSAVQGGKEQIFTPCWWFIGRKRDGAAVVQGNADAIAISAPTGNSRVEDTILEATEATTSAITNADPAKPVVA